MSDRKKVAVSRDAMLMRLRRKLAERGETLRRARGRQVEDLGCWYTTDGSEIKRSQIDPYALSKDFNLIWPWETIEEVK